MPLFRATYANSHIYKPQVSRGDELWQARSGRSSAHAYVPVHLRGRYVFSHSLTLALRICCSFVQRAQFF